MAVFGFPGWFLVARPSQRQKSDGSVTFDLLGQADQKTFTAAREAEVAALIELGALMIMSLSESNEFWRQSAEHVLPSMFVDRWKPTDDHSVKAIGANKLPLKVCGRARDLGGCAAPMRSSLAFEARFLRYI